MHSDARIFIQPVADFLLLVGGVVVHDQPVVLGQDRRGRRLDEGQEFLVTMTWPPQSSDLAGTALSIQASVHPGALLTRVNTWLG